MFQPDPAVRVALMSQGEIAGRRVVAFPFVARYRVYLVTPSIICQKPVFFNHLKHEPVDAPLMARVERQNSLVGDKNAADAPTGLIRKDAAVA